MVGLKLGFLGSPVVERDGVAVSFDTRKAVALLAYLAVTQQPQRREALATLLWPEYEQANAYGSLRRTLWSLKKGIGEGWLAIDSDTIALRGDKDFWLDVTAFHASLEATEAHTHDDAEACVACLSSLQEAVDLYRGDFLAGFTLPDSPPFDEWQYFQAEGLRQEAARALEQLVAIHAARGVFVEGIPYARRWLALDTLHEPAHRALMRLYHWAGQRAAALRQYESCVQALAEEMGVPPEAETIQLYEEIQANRLPPSQAAVAAPHPVTAVPSSHERMNNLPPQRTSFVGREREVAAVGALLGRPDVRLVTLTGPGGSGKTRLSVEVARQLSENFANGVLFVDLASIREPGLVASAIVGVLGVREMGSEGLLESLKSYLRSRRVLLVLDNFEQVVSAAPLLADLLDAAPHLKILVTSREVLHLYGEWEYPVPSLNVPDPLQLAAGNLVATLGESEAVRLLVDRAQAVNPAFALNAANAAAVAELCIRLEGLPLAIELAAARSKLFAPQALLARVAQRLDLLTTSAHDLPTRQQTLRAAIQWSYELLDKGEQVLFARLAVFVGGCTVEAVEAVCHAAGELPLDVLGGLASLVDKSLLLRVEGHAGEPRFTLLETLRLYALERLGALGVAEVAKLRQAHAEYYLTFAERAAPELSLFTGTNPTAWWARLEAEHDNLRAALDWSLEVSAEQDKVMGLRLAEALLPFWEDRSYVREKFEPLLALLAHPKAWERTQPFARTLQAAGRLAMHHSDYDRARVFLEQALTLFRELEDKPGVARTLIDLELLRWQHQDYAGEPSLHEESLSIYQELEDKAGIAWSLLELSSHAWRRGDTQRVQALSAESLAIFRELRNLQGITRSLEVIAQAHRIRGDEAQAMAAYEEALALARKTGHKAAIATILIGLGEGASIQSDYARAITRFNESLELAREAGNWILIAWSLRLLGTIAWLQGDYARATTFHAQSLRLYQSGGDRWGITECLEGFGHIAARQGAEAQNEPQLLRAARLFGAAEVLRQATGNLLAPTMRAHYEHDVTTLHANLDEEQMEAAWMEGRSMTLEQAIAYALAE